jgi:hypothetical protein
LDLIFCIDKWLGVTWHTQPYRPCEITYILHYLPRGMNYLPGGVGLFARLSYLRD